MISRRRINALLTWIASFAVLASALVSSSAPFKLPDAGAGWTEVCSVMGVQMVRMDGGSPADSTPLEPQGHAFEHCLSCTLHLPGLGLPPAPSAGLALVPAAFQLPQAFLLAPRPLFAWASKQARAPPLLA